MPFIVEVAIVAVAALVVIYFAKAIWDPEERARRAEEETSAYARREQPSSRATRSPREAPGHWDPTKRPSEQPSWVGPNEPAPPSTSAGWYQDPWGTGRRYWNGDNWTPEVSTQ